MIAGRSSSSREPVTTNGSSRMPADLDTTDIQQRALVRLLMKHGPVVVTAEPQEDSEYPDLYITGPTLSGLVTVGVVAAPDEAGISTLVGA